MEGRLFVINAFAFTLFLGDRNLPNGEMKILERAAEMAMPSAKLLTPGKSKIEVAAGEMHAAQALLAHYEFHKEAYGGRWRFWRCPGAPAPRWL
jgi:hypothetical protein